MARLEESVSSPPHFAAASEISALYRELELERTGPAEAEVGLFSLPLPRRNESPLALDFPTAAFQPLAWWDRHQQPRRVLAMVVNSGGVPDTLRLGPAAADHRAPSDAWKAVTRTTLERLEFTPHRFSDIASLRGVPAEECTTVESELQLSFGERSLSLQFGATGPKGGHYYWQNVQVDRLWSNPVAQALRVGGVIYNGDTYLWVDLFLLVFKNGVVHASTHFVNTKLHVEGYDFQGLPFIRLSGDVLEPRSADIPVDGLRFQLGKLDLNLEDASVLCSPEHPGKLAASENGVTWFPFSRIFNPQQESSSPVQWEPGFARTVRFQFSLSEAPALVARYTAPSWWYAASGEPGPWAILPVAGRYAPLADYTAANIRGGFTRGRFDGASAGFGNDGDAGIGLMHTYYRSGDPATFKDALDYCYYWADLAVDHRDFTVHQWVGGWGWKTCAYSRFRDVLCGYLETGDPWLLDTAEMTAEAYWAWFRSNWPRSAVGRDTFEIAGWAMLWRMMDSEHARERTLELCRMVGEVLETRGTIGGQMGAGPHPGFHSSLYMTGITMISLLEAAEAAAEQDDDSTIETLLGMLLKLESHFSRDDVELFPSEYGLPRKDWGQAGRGAWAVLASRIYPEMIRLLGREEPRLVEGLRRSIQEDLPSLEDWAKSGRWGNHLVHPLYHDALLLGASVVGNGIALSPIAHPELWPEAAQIATPWGELSITIEANSGEVAMRFSAEQDFEVVLRCRGIERKARSQGVCKMTAAELS